MSRKKKIVIAVVIVAAVALVTAGITLAVVFTGGGGPYKGTVTDAQTNETIANVSVTDGRNVVKTDENGAFELKGYYKTHFVTVTAPTGYWTENYYIKTSDDLDSYNFTLEKSELSADDEHSFLQVSDTEIGAGGVGEWINHIKKTADEENPAFLIHTGDICYEDGLKRHKSDMNTDNMGVPVRYVIGNHDYVEGKYGEELFESIYGPTWYSFEVGNVHYVVTPIHWGDYASCYSQFDRWHWLKNDLENTDPNKKVVMFNHTFSPTDDYVLSYGTGKVDLKKYNLISWAYGHYHYNYIKNNNGVLDISTSRPDAGGIDSSPSGTRKVTVTPSGEVTSKMFYYDLPASVSAPKNNAWSTQLDGNILFTDTIRADGRIYTATIDDGYPVRCGVYCLDEKTGEIIWSVPTKNSVRNNLVYSDGKIIAQDADSNVICIDAGTGKTIWESVAELEFSLGTSSGICADDKTVYAGSSSDVTAFNIEDGKVKWTYHRGKGENSPAEFIITGDKLILSPNWDALVALDKNTGEVLWENEENEIRFRSSTPVAIDNDTLLVADSGNVFVVDSNSGEMKSFTPCEGYSFSSSGQPVIDGRIAYIPTTSNGVVAFDIDKKEIIWEIKPEGSIVGTPPYCGPNMATVESTPVLINGKIIFGASDGYVYEADTKSGKVINKYSVGAPIFGEVAVTDDGYIIVGDFSGRVSKIPLVK